MSYKKLFWKVPLAVLCTVAGVLLLLLVTVACVLYVPGLRAVALDKGVAVAHDKTGMDIELGQLYLSPFHHSPMLFYRAWKGREDLPIEVNIDSLFVGHRGQDTLICVHTLRLQASVLTAGRLAADTARQDSTAGLLSLPIVVHRLRLNDATFHSDSLIPAVGVDAIVGTLDVSSPRLIIAKGEYPLHGLQLYDARVGIDLRSKSTPKDTAAAAKQTPPPPMAFDIPDGDLRNIHFTLTPVGLDIATRSIQTDVLVNVGGNTYDARRIDIGSTQFAIANFATMVDTLYGNACVDLNRQFITSHGLHARSDALGAKADLAATEMNLGTLRVDVTGDADFRGSKASLRGYYDIDDAAYDMHVDVERVDLSSLLQLSNHIVLAGAVDAQGRGIDPKSKAMRSHVKMNLTDAIYDNINVSGLRLDAALANRTVTGNLHLPFSMSGDSLRVAAQTEHQFRVAEYLTPKQMAVDYHATARKVRTHVAGEDIAIEQLQLDFVTDTATGLDMTTEGLNLSAASPMHVMTLLEELKPLLSAVKDSTILKPLTSLTDLSMLDTLRHLIPDFKADVELTHGSPAQAFIEHKGLDIDRIKLHLGSTARRTDVLLSASIPEISHPEDSTAIRLPAADALLNVAMRDRFADISLKADAELTDGAMSMHNLRTKAALRMDMQRTEQKLYGNGRLKLDSIVYNDADLGNHAIDMQLAPSSAYDHSLRANVQLDDIPLELVESFVTLKDIALHGAIRASASVDGLPANKDISAEVQPLRVNAIYKPYEVGIGLGQTPITMVHNRVDLNGLPVYGADSTYLALTGGLDLNTMRLDVSLAADSFAPAKLVKDGKLPVYGDLVTDIRGTVTGPLDSIVADVDVTLLPSTDITYPIDKKNLAQVKPHGMVNVHYGTADGALNLGGQVNVDDGFVRYSPKAYPIMPFHVDSGSHVAFNGPIGQTMLAISASQQVKADVESEGEETRRVDFRTGVRVNGIVDSIGLNTIGFFLEAPEDEQITQELASLDEETREGLAATLLATGMYVGESNAAAQRSGYALSSIINSRINAAMANSKMGKVVDIDLSSAQTEHAGGTTRDLNIAISKSFFQDRFRITVGSTLTDNPEVNQTSGLLNSLSAEYKLTKDGNVLLRAFYQRDYNNILEGELFKSGLGVRAKQEWRRRELFRQDSLMRTYGLIADADVAWRSNNSLGPNLTLTHSIKNLLGKGETFTVKGNGAYYWALRNRHPGDPKKTDTYKLGVTTSLVFPYLHWVGDDNPNGDTRYMVGYQYENIAGGYGVHKVSGSLTYFIRSANNDYVTHAFTPFSLSVVMVKAESDSLMNKAAQYPQLIKVLASNEFVPSIGYTFTYNDYRATRAVNTSFEAGVKESGNLINAIYCLFGHKWNDQNKPLGSITFNQFVKLNAELRNKFNLTDKVCIATRLYAGANIPLGNSSSAPLSEAFYAGGPNGMRAASPYAYGPGNFYSEKYNQNFFHAGDIKFEANFEFRFPIVWKLFGATFVDAGNVWNWYSASDLFKKSGLTDYVEQLQLREELYDGFVDNPYLAQQIALGTGAGLRLDLDGLVVRLDLGVAIHSPFLNYKYDKNWKVDKTQPITTYYNIPSVLDGLRLNFGIGYPF